MIYHVRAVLLGRFQWNADTDCYFAAGAANRYPEKLFSIPYYTLSLVCMFAHIACVHYIKRMEKLHDTSVFIPVEMFRKNSKREAMGICIVDALITSLIMIALTGTL